MFPNKKHVMNCMKIWVNQGELMAHQGLFLGQGPMQLCCFWATQAALVVKDECIRQIDANLWELCR